MGTMHLAPLSAGTYPLTESPNNQPQGAASNLRSPAQTTGQPQPAVSTPLYFMFTVVQEERIIPR